MLKTTLTECVCLKRNLFDHDIQPRACAFYIIFLPEFRTSTIQYPSLCPSLQFLFSLHFFYLFTLSLFLSFFSHFSLHFSYWLSLSFNFLCHSSIFYLLQTSFCIFFTYLPIVLNFNSHFLFLSVSFGFLFLFVLFNFLIIFSVSSYFPLS